MGDSGQDEQNSRGTIASDAASYRNNFALMRERNAETTMSNVHQTNANHRKAGAGSHKPLLGDVDRSCP